MKYKQKTKKLVGNYFTERDYHRIGQDELIVYTSFKQKTAKERFCKCGKKLSIYNKSKQCFSCQSRGSDDWHLTKKGTDELA